MSTFMNGGNNGNGNGKKLTGLLEEKLKAGLINKFSVGFTYEAGTFPIPTVFVTIYPAKRMEGTLISASSLSKLLEAVENFFNNPPT